MKISKLKIKNIKCFEEIEIPFENENNEITNWSLIVGDNGSGKTTILRSLALGLCDAKGASALLEELYGDGFLRQGADKGEIKVTLKDTQNSKEYTIKTIIEGDDEAVSQTRSLESIQSMRREIFAIAYGASRSIMGTRSYDRYALVDSLYTLFNYRASLQNAELGARRIKDHKNGEWEKTQKILKKVLMFDERDEIYLEMAGLYVKKGNTRKISFNDLSDGYQSLTSVILDFLSWKLLDVEGGFDLENLSGIFIIDEIEQHLHPQWQRNIINLLSKQFPKMQFICTTHTPICALGLNDLAGTSQLVKASYVNSHSSVDFFDLKDEFKGYRADQILTSEIFGLSDARSISIENKLEEYREIYLKDERSEDEKEKLQNIEEELKDLPMWENEEDKKTRKKLIKLLEKHENKIASSDDKN